MTRAHRVSVEVATGWIYGRVVQTEVVDAFAWHDDPAEAERIATALLVEQLAHRRVAPERVVSVRDEAGSYDTATPIGGFFS